MTSNLPAGLFVTILASWLSGCGGVVTHESEDAAIAPPQSASGIDAAADAVRTIDVDATLSTQPPVTSSCTSTSAEGGASAYSVSLTTETVYRFLPNGDSYPFRAANEFPNAIDRQDCDDNIALQFNLTEEGLGAQTLGDTLEIWAGTTDCTQLSARSGTSGPLCWQVYPLTEPVLNATVNVYARSLTRYVGASSPAVPLDGGAFVGAGQPESACADVTTLSGCQAVVGVYFMFFSDHAAPLPDAATLYSLGVFVPPAADGTCNSASPVSLGPGNCG
jgi:hypothetical protein